MSVITQTIFCTQCGRPSSAQSSFCWNCGARITLPEDLGSTQNAAYPHIAPPPLAQTDAAPPALAPADRTPLERFLDRVGGLPDVKEQEPECILQSSTPHQKEKGPDEKRLDAPLWNPKAAAGWSILLSAVFGAFLHARNWNSLGRPDLAQRNYLWAAATGLIMLVCAFSHQTLGIARLVHLGSLVAWYLTLGCKQIELVERKYGESFEWKEWTFPLLIGFGAGFVHNLIIAYTRWHHENYPYGTIEEYYGL